MEFATDITAARAVAKTVAVAVPLAVALAMEIHGLPRYPVTTTMEVDGSSAVIVVGLNQKVK